MASTVEDEDVRAEDALSAMGEDLTSTVTGSTNMESTIRKEPSYESIQPLTIHQIKPPLNEKFKGGPVREIIRSVLEDNLGGKLYNSTDAKTWTIQVANEINKQVRELKMKRYKHIVQVIIGELKGAGVKSGVRCLWDSETDGYTYERFTNDTIFCVVAVFAVYLY